MFQRLAMREAWLQDTQASIFYFLEMPAEEAKYKCLSQLIFSF